MPETISMTNAEAMLSAMFTRYECKTTHTKLDRVKTEWVKYLPIIHKVEHCDMISVKAWNEPTRKFTMVEIYALLHEGYEVKKHGVG